MSNFLTAFDGPVVATIGGKQVTFPLLSIRDYLPWLSEMFEEQKRDMPGKIPANMPPAERIRAIRAIMFEPPEPGDLLPVILSPAGTIRVLTLSLKKTGANETDINSIVDAMPAYDAQKIAVLVAAIIKPVPPGADTGGKANPNPLQPGSNPG